MEGRLFESLESSGVARLPRDIWADDGRPNGPLDCFVGDDLPFAMLGFDDALPFVGLGENVSTVVPTVMVGLALPCLKDRLGDSLPLFIGRLGDALALFNVGLGDALTFSRFGFGEARPAVKAGLGDDRLFAIGRLGDSFPKFILTFGDALPFLALGLEVISLLKWGSIMSSSC